MVLGGFVVHGFPRLEDNKAEGLQLLELCSGLGIWEMLGASEEVGPGLVLYKFRYLTC